MRTYVLPTLSGDLTAATLPGGLYAIVGPAKALPVNYTVRRAVDSMQQEESNAGDDPPSCPIQDGDHISLQVYRSRHLFVGPSLSGGVELQDGAVGAQFVAEEVRGGILLRTLAGCYLSVSQEGADVFSLTEEPRADGRSVLVVTRCSDPTACLFQCASGEFVAATDATLTLETAVDESAMFVVHKTGNFEEPRACTCLQEERERFVSNQRWRRAARIGLFAVGASAVAVVSAPLALTALGFTSTGIAAGSAAASMMSAAASASGGGVAAGSTVALLQSAGAAGLSASATAGVAA
eukprot:CAMPEP_0119138912 /NCGR_PEP_ID=MMETSP1310-20130426/26561_1 /TAXON_ID=464262 /ORGANISM="Genus nov. species nov., Strain RCC2339" /LENGTH=294 /DNA_ID=CAMNT_0007130151 /DNA_START=113 /DNA_END=994 /DNA_ORIENTATION=+